MSEILTNLDTMVSSLLNSLGIFGPVLGSLLIIVESMVPILPLSLFITLNFLTFGSFIGFITSYILTVIGCNLAFYLCKRVLSNRIEYLTKKYDKNKLLKLTNKFANIKFINLVMLMAFPFTPAFMVNILSGVSGMEHKKFLIASICGKPFMVFFWGYIGVTLVQSLTEPINFIKVLVLMVLAYIISKIINKKIGLD